LEKLQTCPLESTPCILKSQVWTGTQYANKLDLDLYNTLNFVEKLNEQAGLFDELVEDILSLKKRCNHEMDYRPIIEDVPQDIMLTDL